MQQSSSETNTVGDLSTAGSGATKQTTQGGRLYKNTPMTASVENVVRNSQGVGMIASISQEGTAEESSSLVLLNPGDTNEAH